jgi:hypothetical protein
MAAMRSASMRSSARTLPRPGRLKRIEGGLVPHREALAEGLIKMKAKNGSHIA